MLSTDYVCSYDQKLVINTAKVKSSLIFSSNQHVKV